MFLYIFLPSVALLIIGGLGHLLTMRLAFKSFQDNEDQNHAMVFKWFLIFAPMAFLGMVGAVVSIILRSFGYIE